MLNFAFKLAFEYLEKKLHGLTYLADRTWSSLPQNTISNDMKSNSDLLGASIKRPGVCKNAAP